MIAQLARRLEHAAMPSNEKDRLGDKPWSPVHCLKKFCRNFTRSAMSYCCSSLIDLLCITAMVASWSHSFIVWDIGIFQIGFATYLR